MDSMNQQLQVFTLTSPLSDARVMQQVFSFLPGNWLLLGAVCREWKALYAGIGAKKVRCINGARLVKCAANTTFYSAAVAAPATASLARSCGLEISENNKLQRIAGMLADMETLAALRELGMPLNKRLVDAVAESGRLGILQQLLSEQQCPRPFGLGYSAARSGSISMLRWLKAQSWCSFGTYACSGAAEGGHLAALSISVVRALLGMSTS
jgi:hypothetical protein